MKNAVKPMLLSVSILCITTPALAQSKLDQTLMKQSSTLGTLEKDLMPSLGPTIESVANKMGDPNIGKEIQRLGGSSSGLGTSSNIMGQMSALAQQVEHIPGIGQVVASIINGQQSGGRIPKQFAKPLVNSKLFGKQSMSPSNKIASNAGILGGSSGLLGQLFGTSATESPAVRQEMKQASLFLPQAIQSQESENQQIQQLLKE